MLQVRDLTYRIGGRPIFEGASARVPEGWKVGVVGRNGAGKSTLLKLIAGELQPDGGAIELQRGARLGMVAQEAPGGPQTLLDFVLAADTERAALLAEAETAHDPHRVAEIHDRLSAIAADAAPARAASILAGLGFDHAAQGRSLSEFSGGWRMRVALAALLFAEPDLLLLDEPTNYLDLEGALWLQAFLQRYPRAVLLVSHDRDLLNQSVGAILHVSLGKLELYRGGYDAFRRARAEKAALAGKAQAKQEARRQHLQSFVDRFRAKATKARQAQSRLKALERMTPIALLPQDEGAPRLAFPQPAPLPPPIVAMDGAAVGYDGRPVLRGLSLRIDMDDRIALLGRNGNGKSTFAKLLAGRLAPMAGEVRMARRLKVGYFGQHQIDDLRPERTATQHLAERLPQLAEPQLRARLGAVGLEQDKASTTAASLSGGERARLVFALIAAEAPHLLILDEPTNHLDVEAREALVEALNEYQGAVVLISHDRHFVELAAERLWLVADGRVEPYDGDLDDYRRLLLSADSGGRKPAEAAQTKAARAEARRDGAEARSRLKPLKDAARSAEKEVARLAAERDRVAAALADPKVYAAAGERVVALNRERAELERALAEAEARWLQAAEALEAVGAAS